MRNLREVIGASMAPKVVQVADFTKSAAGPPILPHADIG